MRQENEDPETAAIGTPAETDPVCGMTVKPETAADSFEYDGRTYYFCSAHCLDKFKANPPGFLKKQSSEPPVLVQVDPALARSGDTEVYTCPMHPEVRQNKPGPCPKCGMALERVAPQKPAEKIEYTCPMHPQIVRDAPGNCPICGMALEPRTVHSTTKRILSWSR